MPWWQAIVPTRNPNTTDLVMPDVKSSMVTNSYTPFKKRRGGTAYWSDAISMPPATLTTSATTVRSGSASVQAITRGATSSVTGSAPSTRTASICSVTAIPPSSAAMPAPTRAPTTSAVRIGPSSRKIAVTVTCPMYSRAPKRSSP
jgi:hypothetical protein